MDELIIGGCILVILLIIFLMYRRKTDSDKGKPIGCNEKIGWYSIPGTTEHERRNYENYGKKTINKWDKYDNEKEEKWKKYNEDN